MGMYYVTRLIQSLDAKTSISAQLPMKAERTQYIEKKGRTKYRYSGNEKRRVYLIFINHSQIVRNNH